jgi:hypothetical protein
MLVRTGKMLVAPENVGSDPVGYLTENQSKNDCLLPRGLGKLDLNLIGVAWSRSGEQAGRGRQNPFPPLWR